MNDFAEIGDGYYGVIADAPKPTDYKLLAGTLELPRSEHKYKDFEIQYNQKEIHVFSCTIHAAIGALSDLTGYRFTMAERQQLFNLAMKKGFDVTKGWYTSSAVDLVRNFWNGMFPDKEVVTFRVDVGGEEFFQAIDNDYSIVISYNGNGRFQSDHQADGKLDQISFGVSTYGHCIRITKDPDICTAIENYLGVLKFNNYRLPDRNIASLLSNGVFHKSGYVFVKKADFDARNSAINVPTWAKASIQKAIKKGIVSEGTNFDEEITPEMINSFLQKLKIFKDATGKVDVKRFLVALDRMGQL